MTSDAGRAYEAWYGRTPKNFIAMGYCVAMSATILLIPAPVWARVLVVGTVGGSAVALARMTFSRNPALRVDAEGVTIRPYTLPSGLIAFYPWEDVVQLLIVGSPQTKGQYVQIRLREGAAFSSLSRLTRPKKREVRAVADARVVVNGWTLHPALLAAAVAHFAPAVQVIDATTGFVLNPEQHEVAGDTGQLTRRQVPLAHGWPGWVLAGAGAGLLTGVILAVVSGPANNAASTAAGSLILFALAAVCVAVPAAFYRRYRSGHGAPVPPSSSDISGPAGHALPEDWS